MSDRTVVILRALRGLLVIVVVLAVPAVAQAATTWTVNTAADTAPPGCSIGGTCSLRQAIAASSSGDIIAFDPSLSGQTITLTNGALAVTNSLTISGLGAGKLTVDGTNNNDSVFNINIVPPASTSVTISGLTITGGHARDKGGGGISASSVAALTLDGDVITGNQATLRTNGSFGGGGVSVGGGTVDVSDSAITNNTLTFTDPTGANTDSGGGGVYSNGGAVDVIGSDVSNNSVDLPSSGGKNGGGGIHSEGGGVSLNNSTVAGNSFTIGSGTGGDNGGGGVYEAGGDVTVVFSSIDDNTFTLQSDTGGDDGGGGLASEGGSIGVAFSSISNNTGNIDDTGGDDGGGAIMNVGGADVYLTSTFSGNSMTISGGGTGNGGGAIYSFGGGPITDVTLSGNRINAPGGGLFLTSGTFELKNSIIADNTGGGSAGNCFGGGTFASAGFNLDSGNTCHLAGTGDLVNTEPKLGPLQNNGGPTPTQALLAGSPAIDAGSCTDIGDQPLPFDQREVPRPQPAGGKCDIGAFEATGDGSSPPPPSPPAASPGTPAATNSTAAGFSGSVNPEGQATSVFFQYGIDSRYRPGGGTAVIYDQSTPPQNLPADSTPHAVSASASGLVPNALYHVRLVATNATGTTFGPDQTFTTPAGPAPPPPVLGQTVNAKPVSGQVFVLVAGTLVPLTQGQQLPSGAIVDTRAGTLQLTAAAAKGHKPETGIFGGAIFKLTQARNGLTNLSLSEGAFPGAPSYATCKAHKAAEASAAASKTLQLLHASAKGKFRTSGRYSAATVRGTQWTIADRCDGTLTRVLVHSVAVTDFVRHKTIVLHAGQSYLARAHQPKK